MNITLIDHTQNPEELIGRFSAICYDSDTSRDACIKRTKHCVSKGHLATLRFAYATFKVEGISRACSHQLVRSKHLDYLQESQRYIKQTKPDFVVPNVYLEDQFIIDTHYKLSIEIYNKLLENGVRKEDARFVLPSGVTTSLIVTGNFQAWLDFIRLRSGPEAQWEIRKVALEIKKQLMEIAPNVFN